jgi:hypothetical protein
MGSGHCVTAVREVAYARRRLIEYGQLETKHIAGELLRIEGLVIVSMIWQRHGRRCGADGAAQLHADSFRSGAALDQSHHARGVVRHRASPPLQVQHVGAVGWQQLIGPYSAGFRGPLAVSRRI